MRRNLCLLLVAGLLVGAAPVRIEDAYTIKVKKNGKGDVTTEDKQEIEDSKVKIEDPDGKVLQDKKEVKTTTQAYKETILEKEAGKKATKLRREYTKATVKTGDDEKTLPYQGKTVLIEKKDGKFHFTIEGGAELTGKDAALLNKSFNKDAKDDSDGDDLEKAIFPKKPVKVNESWSIDAPALIKSFEKDSNQPIPVDKAKVAGTGKLLKAYKKDGKQYGVLDIHIDVPLKGDFPLGPGQSAPVRAGSTMTMRIKVDGCIDGTSSDAVTEMSMDMDLNAVIKAAGGKEYKMSLVLKQKEKGTEKDLSKK
jgi:hypothetical protein